MFTFYQYSITTNWKKTGLLLLLLCGTFSLTLSQNVAINTDGSSPNSDAILHLKSTSKGLLIPQVNSTQRVNISGSSDGLMVYDITTNSFWFRDAGTWQEIASGAIEAVTLEDDDSDTKIQVEESSDEDQIRFDIAGSEQLTLRENDSGLFMLEIGANNQNAFIGFKAGENTTHSGTAEGRFNTFLGNFAGRYNTSGNWNTFLGHGAGDNNSSGIRNIFIGGQTGQNNETGEGNTAVGTFAGRANTDGNYNTMLGEGAGSFVSGGDRNTFIGYNAGQGTGNHTKSGNVFIGYQVGRSETGSNKLMIHNSNSSSPLLYGEFNNDYLKVNGSLEVTALLQAKDELEVTDRLKVNGDAAINTDGSSPNSDAILHLKSTSKGLLIPQMTSTQRSNLSGSSDGLLVYDITTNSFWFRDDGTWQEIASGAIAAESLTDGDSDTKIQVEESSDDDQIRFDIAGTQQFGMRSNSSGLLMMELASNSRNLFIGYDAGANTTLSGTFNGRFNTFLGNSSGRDNDSGFWNTFMGHAAGSNNTSGSNNIFIGGQTGQENESGEGNTVVGTFAGRANTDGNHNTMIGESAGSFVSSGDRNTFIGYDAGRGNSNHSKSGNVFIGYQAGRSETGSHKLYIHNNNSSSPLLYGEFNNNYLKVNGDLEVANSLEIKDNLEVEDNLEVQGNIEISSGATSTPAAGHIYRNSGPMAYGYISSAGNITTDYGISSVTKTATGSYTIVLDNDFTVNPVVMVTPYSSIAGLSYTATYWAQFPNKILVNIINESEVNEDQPFSLMIMGW